MNFSPVGQSNAAADAASSQLASNAKSNSQLMGKDAFLELLVAQIKNQNPLNPADGAEFLSQLAQFSQLEQSMGIRDGIDGLREQVNTITDALATMTEAGGEENTQGDNNV